MLLDKMLLLLIVALIGSWFFGLALKVFQNTKKQKKLSKIFSMVIVALFFTIGFICICTFGSILLTEISYMLGIGR